MDTDDLKLSKAASEYIERRAAFWFLENNPDLGPRDINDAALNECLETLYREWVELAKPADESLNHGWSVGKSLYGTRRRIYVLVEAL